MCISPSSKNNSCPLARGSFKECLTFKSAHAALSDLLRLLYKKKEVGGLEAAQ